MDKPMNNKMKNTYVFKIFNKIYIKIYNIVISKGLKEREGIRILFTKTFFFSFFFFKF